MTPTLQSILLADAVHHEPGTGRVTVAGVFDTVTVAPAPGAGYAATVYLVVRGVQGRGEITLAYVDLAHDLVLVRRTLYFEAGGPPETVGFAVRVDPVPVHGFGSFAWEVYHESELLGAARVEVVRDQTGGRDAGGPTRATHNLRQVGHDGWGYPGTIYRFPAHVTPIPGGFKAVATTLPGELAGGGGTESNALDSLGDLLAEMIGQWSTVGSPFPRTAAPPTPPGMREWVALVYINERG